MSQSKHSMNNLSVYFSVEISNMLNNCKEGNRFIYLCISSSRGNNVTEREH